MQACIIYGAQIVCIYFLFSRVTCVHCSKPNFTIRMRMHILFVGQKLYTKTYFKIKMNYELK
jgi:hypothetical protein